MPTVPGTSPVAEHAGNRPAIEGEQVTQPTRLGHLFRAIDVWQRRPSGQLVRYRCFQVLPDGGYCVQSADFHPQDARQTQFLETQYLELLSELDPDERSKVHPSLEEAIEAHQTQFDT
jgi:hypothetical protein